MYFVKEKFIIIKYDRIVNIIEMEGKFVYKKINIILSIFTILLLFASLFLILRKDSAQVEENVASTTDEFTNTEITKLYFDENFDDNSFSNINKYSEEINNYSTQRLEIISELEEKGFTKDFLSDVDLNQYTNKELNLLINSDATKVECGTESGIPCNLGNKEYLNFGECQSTGNQYYSSQKYLSCYEIQDVAESDTECLANDENELFYISPDDYKNLVKGNCKGE